MKPVNLLLRTPLLLVVAGLLALSSACGDRGKGRDAASAVEGQASAKSSLEAPGAAKPPPSSLPVKTDVAPSEEHRTPVEGLQIIPRDFQRKASYVGHLLPQERVTLKAEIEGVAEQVTFREGKAVRRGQVLVHISTAQRKLQLRLARSNQDLAESSYRRLEILHRGKLIPSSRLDESRNQRDVARLKVKLAGVELNKSALRTPISGLVKTRHVEPGEYLNKGGLVAEILDMSRVRVKIDVPELEIRYFKPGKRAVISVDAWPGKTYTGQVQKVGLEADLKSRSFPVELLAPNPDKRLRAGMLARVSVSLREYQQQLLIPRHAVLEKEEGPAVFVVREGRAQPRPITLGVSTDGMVQVTRGLEAGDWVVVTGHRKLTPNEKVAMKRLPFTAPIISLEKSTPNKKPGLR